MQMDLMHLWGEMGWFAKLVPLVLLAATAAFRTLSIVERCSRWPWLDMNLSASTGLPSPATYDWSR